MQMPSGGQHARLHVISPIGKNGGEVNYVGQNAHFEEKENLYHYGNHPELRNICVNNVPFSSEGHDLFGPDCASASYYQMAAEVPQHRKQPAARRRLDLPNCGSRKLKPEAVEVMNKWFKEHLKHPYPSQEMAEQIAKNCNITMDQVKKWFANKRMRTRNTKSLHEIALARRRFENNPILSQMTDAMHW
jgi:hypothetical protein